MIACPGQRQIRQHLVPLVQPVEVHGIGGGGDGAARTDLDPFRPTGRPRRVENDADIVALALGQLRVEPGIERRIVGERAAAIGDHVVDGEKPGMVVIAQPALLVIDQPCEARHALRHGDDFVDLLLVLHRRETRVGMGEDIADLIGDGVGIDRHRHRAEPLRRRERPIELRPVVAENGESVAAFQPEPRQAEGIGTDLALHLGPTPAMPDAAILVAERRARAKPPRVPRQQLRERVPVRDVALQHSHPSRRVPRGRAVVALGRV